MSLIHPKAIIDPAAELAEDVTVGPYAVIEAGVRIGPGTRIGPHALIAGNTSIGARNRISAYAVIGTPPQDKKFRGGDVRLEIGDDNTFREFVTVNTGTEDGGGVTLIGHRNLFLAYTHVAHDCRIGNDNTLSNMTQLAGHCTIGDGVTFGGITGVHQFVRIGDGAMIGGGSMVTLDIPPYCTAVGNRAALFGLNSVGLKRRGMDANTMAALKEAYRIVFRNGLKLADALDEVEATLGNHDAVLRFVNFIRASERGVARPERDA